MEPKMDSPNNMNKWLSHFKLAAICILIGIVIYLFGWANYLIVSILISVGIGFTIRMSRHWLGSHYPSMSLSLRYFWAGLLSFVVWGVIPILFGTMSSAGQYTDELQKYLGVLFIGSFTMVLVSFVYFRSEQTLALKRSLYQVELEQIQKDKLLLETQLRLLQSQIEPHFLFNTLANIQALIPVNTKQANDMLVALTSLLRQSLDSTRTEWLTLGHELRFNKAYLAIQKIRLGERLRVEYDITDTHVENTLFPPMLLQPLVENAVTHGIEQLKNGGTLKLSIKHNEDTMIINIINHCEPSGSQHKGTKIGLNNVQQRLTQLYGGRAKLEYDGREANLVSVTLEVPIDVSAS